MNYKVLIADDEDYIRNQLEYIIHKTNGFELCASCCNGIDTLEQILSLNPDIVLLDIRMPGFDGIKLGMLIEKAKKTPYLIYVTAYQEYAVKALNLGARGYILKPFSDDQVEGALIRAAECMAEKHNLSNPSPLSSTTKVASYDEEKILFFNQSDIIMATAKNRKVYLVVNGNEYLSRYSLTELEGKLDKTIFFRSHRNYLINLNQVANIVPWFNNSYVINMKDGNHTFEVPLSRDNVKRFKTIMGV